MKGQQIKNLLKEASDMVCIVDNTQMLTWVNQSFLDTLGLVYKDFINKSLLDFVADADQDLILEQLGRRKSSEQGLVFSFTDHTGKEKKVSATFEKDADENVYYIIAQIIKEPKISRGDEEISDGKFKALVENSTSGFAIMQPDGSSSYLSPGVESILGYSKQEANAMNLFDILHQDDQAHVIESISECLQNPGVPIAGSLARLKRKDGKWVWIDATVTNLLHEPSVRGIIDDFKDVTEVKNATDNLKQAKDNYQNLFNLSPVPMFIYEVDNYQIMEVNEATVQNYGYSREECKNMTVRDLRPMKDRHLVDEIHRDLEEKSGLIQLGTITHQKKDGSFCKMNVVGQKLIYNNTDCLIAAADDVTEKELLQGIEKLEREIMFKSIQLDFDLVLVLNEYLVGLESLFPGMYVSILKVKDNKIWNYVSPSLPKAYLKEIDGVPIGTNAGSCGTAAFTGKKVIVKDIGKNPLWANYRSVALKNNLQSCWSQPIFNAKKEVLATIANYYSFVKSPSNLEQELFDRSAALLSLLFEHHQKSKDLLSSNERYDYINKVTNDVLYDWDVEEDVFNWSESFQKVFGHTVKGVFRLKDWVALMHHEDDALLRGKWDSFIHDKKQSRWIHEFRFQKEDGSFAYVEEIGYLLRDNKGKAVRMFGVVRDRTAPKTELLQNQLLEDVSQVFNSNISITETLNDVLDHLNHYADFALSEIWLINHDNSAINLIAHAVNFNNGKLFYKESKSFKSFVKGEGLPGTVWENNKAAIWNNLGDSSSFKRRYAAKKSGLMAGLGLPIFHNRKLIGVLLLGVDTMHHKLKFYKKFFEPLEHRLGIEIIRKKAEEELHMFFQYSPDILCIAAQDGKFRKVNPAFSQLLGYSEEEITNQPFTNFLLDDGKTSSNLPYHETIASETPGIEYVNRYLTKSGEHKWLSWNSSQVFGTEDLVFAYGRDITERKELQDLLDQANQLAQIGGWEYDLETQEIYWSEITRSIHEAESGFNPTLEESMGFYKDGEHKDKLIEALDRAIQQHEKWDLECIILTVNNQEKWVRTIGEPEIREGKCVRIVGSFQDINKYKKLELRFKSVSNNIPGVIFQYKLHPDGSDQLQYLSNGSNEIWGMSPQECADNNELVWQQIEAGGDLPKVRQSIYESMQNNSNWKCEWRSIKPDGSKQWHKGQGSPQKQSDGSTIWDSLVIDITEKKELEFLLERSSQMARIGSWEMDLRDSHDQLIYWSQMTREIFEVENDYEVARPEGLAFFVGESQQKLENAVAALIKNDVMYDLELLIKTGKGNEKWIRCIGQSERVDGRCIKIFGSFQDIHERKIAELKLKNVLEERNSILENISDGFFSVDNKWIVNYWNEKAELLLHTAKNDILNKNLWSIFNDPGSSSAKKKYFSAMELQEPAYFDDYYEPTNSWFEVSAYPSQNGLSVFFKDITDKKKNEELIKLSNERFEMIAQATNDAIWDYNVEENELYWGGGFQKLFNYDLSRIEPSFELLLEKIHPNDRARIAQKIEEYMGNHSSGNWHEEYQFLRGDGTYAFVIDRAIFLRNTNGKVQRVIGAMTDISHRKEYEESLKELNATLDHRAQELIKSNAELEQFAYVASHDLQEPLRMVSSFMNLLKMKYDKQLDEKANQYIHYAVDGADRMRQIILDLLEYSRAGKTEEDQKKEPIKNIIDEACLLQRKAIQDKKAKVNIKKMPAIEIHKMPYLQVFQNLIGNAIKYTERSIVPEITISSISSKAYHTIIIKDNGIGIDKTQFDTIFIIFKRLHTKQEFKGTGMGLAIVKKIVENYGGKIWLESEPGKGSKFYFTIPKQ